jgi:hypothetical protein|tara:strand:+ start:12015 stop:12164 length:150 start_codon:yes stop_codon:yes gene_type:complete
VIYGGATATAAAGGSAVQPTLKNQLAKKINPRSRTRAVEDRKFHKTILP